MDWDSLRAYGTRARQAVAELLGAGPLHRRTLAQLDMRIAVSGVRGKSTAVRWLYDIFHGRGYDTYAKVTGTNPRSIYNGVEHEIRRGPQVRLYENEREIRKYDPDDVAIIENQGIREYTTRLVNERFVEPDVVFLTNVREDHLGTLGNERITIARSLARAVPAGTHVVNGEQDPEIRTYLETQLARRDATVSHVEIPSRFRSLPGIECIYGVNEVLGALGEPTLSPTQLRAMRNEMRVSWRTLSDGHIYNAADVNDIQSTELVRRALTQGEKTVIEPLVFLRPDRRGRTASFRHYLERLHEEGIIRQAHAVGADAPVLARRLSFQTWTYDSDAHEAADVLDEVLDAGRPVLLMGNTVNEFMDEMRAEIDTRAAAAAQGRGPDRDADRRLFPGSGHLRRRRGRHRPVRRRRERDGADGRRIGALGPTREREDPEREAR